MAIPHSPAWRAFEKSVTIHAHHPKWQGDYNLGALEHLTGDERARAEDLLCEQMVERPEIRAPRALAFMKSDFAVPVLEAALHQWKSHGAFRVEVVRALSVIQDDAKLVALLAEVLHQDLDADARCRAAEALTDRPEDAAQTALFKGLADDEAAVRATVVEALWKRLKMPEKHKKLGELAALKKGLTSAKPRRRAHWRNRLGDYLRDRGMGWIDPNEWS